jgi:2-aminoadipate transaminase
MIKHPFSQLARRTADPPISWLMKMALERPGLISLAAGFTDDLTLPVTESREFLQEILASPSVARAALQYGTTAGDQHLREVSAARLHQQDGPGAPSEQYQPERLLITHGSQQLLYLVTECLCDPGDIVLVEDPTYFVYLGILQSHGLEARGVRMEEDGLDLSHLEQVLERLREKDQLRRLKFLYLVSYFQNPTGITTSLEKKKSILDLLRQFEKAAGHPIYLLEDAAYRDLQFSGRSQPSCLAAPGAEQRVIYAGTYSKPFATGIRVGYGLLPESLLQVALRVKANHDFGTSNLLQQILLKALSSHRYEDHLEVLRKRYRKKAGMMLEAIEAHFPAEAKWVTPEGGLYVWVRLSRQARTGVKSPLFQWALENNVLYVPGELCYAPDPTRRPPRNEMRLSFGSAHDPDIREGIKRLGQALRKITL